MREKIGKKYTQILNQKGFYKTPHIEKYNWSVYAQYTIQVDEREKIINFLKNKGIPTAIHYPILLPDQVALNKNRNNVINQFLNRKMYKSFDIENSRSICSRVLSLPMHPNLTEEDQKIIIKSLMESQNNH